MPCELITNQENDHFEVLSYLILCNNIEPFLDWTVTFIESGFRQQPAMTGSAVEQRSSKALPKDKLVPKKGHGHCLVVYC